MSGELERAAITIRGKRYLDVGCAYGGFLVAFARRGACEVVGVDLNPELLDLAAANLSDHGTVATLKAMDLLDASVRDLGEFDIITCNDVIEHVPDPKKALLHLADLLRPRGVVCLEVPNRYFVRFLTEDGHFKLPGLTLLARPKAARYFRLNFAGDYDVWYYRKLEWYLRQLEKLGLQTRVLNPPGTDEEVARLDQAFLDARAVFETFAGRKIDSDLAAEIRTKADRVHQCFRAHLQDWVSARERGGRRSDQIRQGIHRRFGMDFWRLIAQKSS